MAYDFKKELKEFYRPSKKPGIITVPPVNYIAVRGKGDPNSEEGEYKESISLLYPIAFTLKMSYKGDYKIENFFNYVVPPLEGLWWQEGKSGIDYSNKEDFNFISMIRLPNFIKKEDFEWAIKEASEKKNTDFSKVEFLTLDEGQCVQCMHTGPYDNEPETMENINAFLEENSYEPDLENERLHHEIYLSDPRRCKPENLKTVLRIPIKKRT